MDITFENRKIVVNEVLAFRHSLDEETDRGCALMAAAYLDDALAHLLRAFLVDDGAVTNPLFEFNGPLGTFSSRINFAYSLGLIGPQVRRDLNLIRKIRNTFGHTAQPTSFSTESIANQCRTLYHSLVEGDLPPRRFFVSSALGILGLIHGQTMSVKRREPFHDTVVDSAYRAQILETDLEALLEKFNSETPPEPPATEETA